MKKKLRKSLERSRERKSEPIFESCVHGQTDNRIFYKIETYLGRLLLPEIYVIPNFVKIVRTVLENVNRSLFTRVIFTDKQTDNPIFSRLRPI